jgi:hypothetical protein
MEHTGVRVGTWLAIAKVLLYSFTPRRSDQIPNETGNSWHRPRKIDRLVQPEQRPPIRQWKVQHPQEFQIDAYANGDADGVVQGERVRLSGLLL